METTEQSKTVKSIVKIVEELQEAMPPLDIALNPTNVEYSSAVGIVPTEEEYERTMKALRKLSIAEVRKRFPMKDFPSRNRMAMEYLSFDAEFLQKLKDVYLLILSMASQNEKDLEFIPDDTRVALRDIACDIDIECYRNPDCSEDVKALRKEIEDLSLQVWAIEWRNRISNYEQCNERSSHGE